MKKRDLFCKFMIALVLVPGIILFALSSATAGTVGAWEATDSMHSYITGHTATLLPNGMILVVGGKVSSDFLASAELYDPATKTSTATGSMADARANHTATLLTDGKVLVAGGGGTSGRLDSAELYDPATGTFTSLGWWASMNVSRNNHTATLLPDGKVLLAGGYGGGTGYLDSTELYDPATGTFTATGSMGTVRTDHTATLLPNGKVLVTGGIYRYLGYLSSAELYDPATGTFTETGSMGRTRYAHTATLLSDGRVLVAGGGIASAELYDPATETFNSTGGMTESRVWHIASLLQNGKVLVAGGYSSGSYLASAELYDPATGAFTATVAMNNTRSGATATMLPCGKVLVIGGYRDIFISFRTAELYDPAVGSIPTSSMLVGRYRHTATLLPNEKVLVAGGFVFDSAELYNPATGVFAATGTMGDYRYDHTATPLPDGKVLLAGGNSTGGTGHLDSAELYDPATETFTATGSMGTTREAHSATLLPDGKVLIAGGVNASGRLASAELYDPVTGTFTATGSMGTARNIHTATLLSDGRVLIAGGYGDTGYLDSAELYDPATGTFTSTGSMADARTSHTATLLSNGKVLVTGGRSFPTGGPLASAELYDPATGTFTSTGSMTPSRTDHTATLLPVGKVLVAGGLSGGGILALAELYDPATETFTATGSMETTRDDHTATLLANGNVLIAGGWGPDPSSAELYQTTPDAEKTYYGDSDGDGYGNPDDSIQECTQPSGYVVNNSDNCGDVYNPDQTDTDGDGIGDACDFYYTLTITTAGTGSGTVTSSDGGIGCGVDCSEDYFSVTDVTLMAVADSGSTFTGWSGHPDCSDGVVTMDAGKTCTATFTLNTQTLTLSTAGTGSGSVSGAGTYNYGDTATVSATADTGSTFTGWSGTDSAECTTGSVLMDTNKTCTATFSIVTIPTVERDALIELYNSTDGDNWTDNTNWLGTEESECTWFGVTCDAGGNNVTGIYLPINNLVGTIPVELGNLTNLRYLYLYSNQLTGSIPVELGNLANLQILRLSGNQLTGSIPPELGNLTNLVTLNLWSNQLAGPIPVELGNLSNLQYLILSHNQLTGSIPVELGNLVNLQDFRLLGNQLTGPIPAELGNLINLQSLWLNSNQLTGPIPMELGNLTNLTTFYLYSNQLTGPIPMELGNLTNLTRLWLSKNQLTGPIPTELGNLTNLTSLWLSSNQLTGPIPVELTYLTALFDNNSHFGLNALYTTDATLRDFLNSKDYSWEATQTIAPANLTASEVLDIDITLTWTSILYTGDTGGYEVYYSETSGVPYTLFEITADKAVTSSTVTGLAPDTTYYFMVRTVTNSHANNQNTLYSEYTPEISATTYPQAFTLTVTREGTGGGTVTSDLAGINCGLECTNRYGDGIGITLTATPDAGSLFNGWGGDPDCLDGVVTMDSDKTCTINFAMITAPLNLTPGDTDFTDLTPTITSTPFADTGGGVTHVASQWQVGERINFISDSFQDTTSGDDEYIEYTLPFMFPFFERSITSISINTNGLIELLEDGEFCWECDDYDTHSDGDHINNMDAIFASNDDLTMDYLNVYDQGSYFMFEWFGSTLSDNDSTTYPLYFQVEIHSDGTINWNFNQMDFLIYNDMYSGVYPNGGTEIDVGYAINTQSSWLFDPATQTVSQISFNWDTPVSYFLYDSGESTTDLTSYTVPITANLTYGNAFFWRVRYKLSTGEWTPWSSPTSFTVSHPFNPYDTNQNWEIGDFELLNAIDDWAVGDLGDFELLDLIDYWAAGCYHWDDTAARYMAGCL